MNPRHFETLGPICPLCRVHHERQLPLKVGWVTRHEGDHILEGALQCTGDDCLFEYPIIDGIPILLPDTRTYVADNVLHLVARDDLSGEIESMLGECGGPGSAIDATRQHLSNYAWDHYAEFDPQESQVDPSPGSVARALEQGLSMTPDRPSGPVLDAGCSVGRTTFEFAQRTDDLVLGVDIDFSMLRLAADVLRHGRVRYARRRVGMLYDRREFPVSFENTDNVDFWACDATALPFVQETFSAAISLNVLDCVQSPLDLLRSLQRVLKPGGQLVLSTPYDWSGVTPPDAWIGGHSPRSPGGGASEHVLRDLLTPGARAVSIDGLRLTAEREVPWQVRLHDRSVVSYKMHLLAAVAELPTARTTDVTARTAQRTP